jgi:hypothetical protein
VFGLYSILHHLYGEQRTLEAISFLARKDFKVNC